MAVTPSSILESLQTLVARFAEVAMTDPVVAAMLISGAVFTGLSVSVFGYLTLGAALDAVIGVIPSIRTPPEE
jgi:hypothetical protein